MASFILLESDNFRESILRILRILSLKYFSSRFSISPASHQIYSRMLDGIRIALFLHKALTSQNKLEDKKGCLLYLRNGSTSFGHFRQQPLCTHMWRKAGLTTFYFWFNNGFHGHIFFSCWKGSSFSTTHEKLYQIFFGMTLSHKLHGNKKLHKHGSLANKIICIFFWIQNRLFVSCPEVSE